MTRSANPFRHFDSSPEVIRLMVTMYVKHPLSMRNLEDLKGRRRLFIFGRYGIGPGARSSSRLMGPTPFSASVRVVRSRISETSLRTLAITCRSTQAASSGQSSQRR